MRLFQFCKRHAPPGPEPADALGYLSRYYSTRCDEDGRLLTRHGQVEYLTTMRYIEKYAESGCKILEIGAATGRYSLALARMGYDVTAIELLRHNIDIFQKKLKPGDRVDLQQGNALDLSRFADGSFDMVLLFGPMYHLIEPSEQLLALREALRVAKPGGMLYVAYCICDMSIMENGMKSWFWSHLEDGHIDPVTYACKSNIRDVFQLYRKEDIDALAARLPARRLHYVATDGTARLIRDTLKKMTPERFAKFMDYHYFLCERPDMVGATHHSLDVLRKG